MYPGNEWSRHISIMLWTMSMRVFYTYFTSLRNPLRGTHRSASYPKHHTSLKCRFAQGLFANQTKVSFSDQGQTLLFVLVFMYVLSPPSFRQRSNKRRRRRRKKRPTEARARARGRGRGRWRSDPRRRQREATTPTTTISRRYRKVRRKGGQEHA